MRYCSYSAQKQKSQGSKELCSESSGKLIPKHTLFKIVYGTLAFLPRGTKILILPGDFCPAADLLHTFATAGKSMTGVKGCNDPFSEKTI